MRGPPLTAMAQSWFGITGSAAVRQSSAPQRTVLFPAANRCAAQTHVKAGLNCKGCISSESSRPGWGLPLARCRCRRFCLGCGAGQEVVVILQGRLGAVARMQGWIILRAAGWRGMQHSSTTLRWLGQIRFRFLAANPQRNGAILPCLHKVLLRLQTCKYPACSLTLHGQQAPNDARHHRAKALMMAAD